MTTHTPGPWYVEVIHYDGAFTICHGINKHYDGPAGDVGRVYCSEADARLMAAAPELLTALKLMIEDARSETVTIEFFNRAVNAVAKATGEKQ